MDYFSTDDRETVDWLAEVFHNASMNERRVRLRTDEKNQLQVKIGEGGWTAPIKSTPDPYRDLTTNTLPG